MINKISVQPVILCGGAGTRLWPLSRTGFPKQFLCLTGEESLFQQAARRLAELTAEDRDVQSPLIVMGDEHRFLAVEQLRETGIPLGAALLEPVGRNTAPALTLAALAAQEQGGDPILVVTPADQIITNGAAFTAAVQDAIREALCGSVVILGVSPDKPETGYGYIHAETDSVMSARLVQRFVEKPDAISAQSYLEQGCYYWNAGIFVLKASVWLDAIQEFRPDILETTRNVWLKRSSDSLGVGAFIRPCKNDFKKIPAESVDYAVLEKCPGSRFPIKMVPLNAGWSDLGAWDAVWQALPKDQNGNAHIGDVLTTDSRNTLVHANSRLVSVVGVENLIVIETADAVLVVDRSRSQDVKAIVSKLSTSGRDEHVIHRKVHRPWGWYDGIDEGERFKVKRIQVRPKASLSLQMHHHRAEHWVVVRGTAEITCGDKTVLLGENQSTYIPLGEIHRLANPGTIPLEIIEVQSGSYLREDDIVRFKDNYGRKE